jgi:chromosomal replication initiation ATPase DnaA
MVADAQSFPFTAENRSRPDRKAKALRKAGALQKGDERILGDGEFVEKVLAQAQEAFERKYRLKAKGLDIDKVAERVAEMVGIDPAGVWAAGKQPKWVQARSLLCYLCR